MVSNGDWSTWITTSPWVAAPTARWPRRRSAGPRRALCGVFGELARKFQSVVDAIGEISDSAHVWSSKDILRLYELWLKTGSRRAQGLLQQLGVQPAPTSLLLS